MKGVNRVTFAVLAFALLATAPAIKAQDLFTYGEADTGFANVNLQVYVPLLGWQTVSIQQQPIDQAATPAGTGAVDLPSSGANILLGSNVLAAFNNLDDYAANTTPGLTVTGSAYSHIGSVSLLGGLIQATNLAAQVASNGDDSSGTPAISLSASTTVGNVMVNGVSVAQGSIPANTTIPVSFSLPVSVAGLINTIIPISGQLTLNEQGALGPYGLDLNAMHLQAQGAVSGLAQINIDLVVGGPTVESGEFVNSGTSCPAGQSESAVYIAHPTDPNLYFVCDYGRAIVMKCPMNLVWNESIGACDFAENTNAPALKRLARR